MGEHICAVSPCWPQHPPYAPATQPPHVVPFTTPKTLSALGDERLRIQHDATRFAAYGPGAGPGSDFAMFRRWGFCQQLTPSLHLGSPSRHCMLSPPPHPIFPCLPGPENLHSLAALQGAEHALSRAQSSCLSFTPAL